MLRLVTEPVSVPPPSTTSLATGAPACPAIPVAINRTVSEAEPVSSTGLALSKPCWIALLPSVLRRTAPALSKFCSEFSVLSNTGLGAGGPGPPALPLTVNPVTAEMILRGSLTSRTLPAPGLVSAGVEIVLTGAVQTLSGVLGRCGAWGTSLTGGLVSRVTDTVQEVAGGAGELLD